MSPSLRPDSLVLYKVRPARVLSVSNKIEIELDGGKTKRVRDKDVVLLHPGPVGRLADLAASSGDVDEAWSLLEGAQTNLRELAELAFGDYTPASAWAAWELVADGLYFEGTHASARPSFPAPGTCGLARPVAAAQGALGGSRFSCGSPAGAQAPRPISRARMHPHARRFLRLDLRVGKTRCSGPRRVGRITH